MSDVEGAALRVGDGPDVVVGARGELLPKETGPGLRPEVLTDAQALARIRYGHENGWAQRRVAAFAGRSPSTVHKLMKAFAAD
jgi:hypothetical protein